MGRCSLCKEKIRYNAFKKIKGIIYCLKCVPEKPVLKATFVKDAIEKTISEAKTLECAMEDKSAYDLELEDELKEEKKPKKRKRSKKKSGKQ